MSYKIQALLKGDTEFKWIQFPSNSRTLLVEEEFTNNRDYAWVFYNNNLESILARYNDFFNDDVKVVRIYQCGLFSKYYEYIKNPILEKLGVNKLLRVK